MNASTSATGSASPLGRRAGAADGPARRDASIAPALGAGRLPATCRGTAAACGCELARTADGRDARAAVGVSSGIDGIVVKSSTSAGGAGSPVGSRAGDPDEVGVSGMGAAAVDGAASTGGIASTADAGSACGVGWGWAGSGWAGSGWAGATGAA